MRPEERTVLEAAKAYAKAIGGPLPTFLDRARELRDAVKALEAIDTRPPTQD